MITDDHKSTGVKKDAAGEDEEPVSAPTGEKRKAPSSDAGRAKRVKSETLSTPGDTRPATPASSAAFTPVTSTSLASSFVHMQNFAAMLPPAPLTPPASASEGSTYNFGASPGGGSDTGGLGALDVDAMSLELDLASAFPDASSFVPTPSWSSFSQSMVAPV
ncbi:unnamed protein product [Peniophora sp. CBMAI 1063]|nr:unnamed protein product [Peniophora sp. CBMAI 1063]